jgi:predicted small metal-binding protein
MGLKIICKDLEKKLGVEATFRDIAEGETMEELTEDLWEQAKKVHGYTDEELLSQEVTDAVKAVIKKD